MNRVLTVLLENPPHNVMTLELMRGITKQLKGVGEEHCAVLFRGGGEDFSAGVDVKQHLPGEGGEEMTGVLEDLFLALDQVMIPTISAVRGSCLGGGLELASSCDFMIAAESARIGNPEIKLGVIAPISLARLPRRIGRGRALDLLLTGRDIDGREAERIGLATLACAEHEVMPRAQDLAKRFSEMSPRTLRIFKKAIRDTEALSYADALRHALSVYRDEVLHSRDGIEGLNAFLEKRQPRWKK